MHQGYRDEHPVDREAYTDSSCDSVHLEFPSHAGGRAGSIIFSITDRREQASSWVRGRLITNQGGESVFRSDRPRKGSGIES